MKNKTINVSIRVIAMFMGAILLSFIPLSMPKYFGDWICEGSLSRINGSNYEFSGCNYYNTFHKSTWHWGYQHWLFFFMGLCLMIIQIVDIINIINKENKK